MKISTALFLLFVPFALSAQAAEKNVVLDQYVAVATALAADDLEGAREAAKDLVTIANADQPEMSDQAQQVASAKEIEAAREAFRPLSTTVEKLAVGVKGYYIMNCPMAGADWVQDNPEVANPYYGASMLRCGGIKK